jgi:hypothetical protein
MVATKSHNIFRTIGEVWSSCNHRVQHRAAEAAAADTRPISLGRQPPSSGSPNFSANISYCMQELGAAEAALSPAKMIDTSFGSTH